MSYTYRDPARVTPARLAELQAHDRRMAALERPRHTAVPRGEQTAARDARVARYAALRDAGLRQWEAAIEMGITRRTAKNYERARRQLTGGNA